METSTVLPHKSTHASTARFAKIMTMSLSIVMLCVAIGWVGFFLTQY